MQRPSSSVRLPLPALGSSSCLTLVDTLVSAGLRPDRLVGHSLGEVACAYADDCLTMVEAMKVAFVCATVYTRPSPNQWPQQSSWTGLSPGQSAPKQASILPATIPRRPRRSSVLDFVAEVKASNGVATVIDSAGIAFHSPLMLVSCSSASHACALRSTGSSRTRDRGRLAGFQHRGRRRRHRARQGTL